MPCRAKASASVPGPSQSMCFTTSAFMPRPPRQESCQGAGSLVNDQKTAPGMVPLARGIAGDRARLGRHRSERRQMLIRIDDSKLLYRQIYDHFREAILSGRLHAGAPLPSTRALAAELGVSRRTVLIAYDQLLAEGYTVGMVGSGTVVAALPWPPAGTPVTTAATAARSRHAAAVRMSAYAERLTRAAPLPPPEWRLREYPLRYDFSYGLPSIE